MVDITRLTGGTVPADGKDPRTFPSIWNATATSLESALAEASVTVSASAPTSPSNGDLWWDTFNEGLFMYYTGGETPEWIATTGTLESDVATLQADVVANRLMLETTEKTSSYTLALDDAYKVVLASIDTGSVTVPASTSVDFPIGTVINVYNINPTDVIIQGGVGVTVRNAGSLAQYGEVSLRKRAADEWVLAGSVS